MKTACSRAKRWLRVYSRRLLLLLLLCVVTGIGFFLPPIPLHFQDLKANSSLILSDRHGTPLRRELSARQGVNSWIPLSEIPANLKLAVLLAEDSRFYYHLGIDPLALLRAIKDNIVRGQVVSGASTVTQQLCRTLAPVQERSLTTKLQELYWATRLEAHYGKDEILEAYLNRVAFGPSVYGVAEASRFYFAKPPTSLSLAEIATLAILIRAPSSFDPFTEAGREELRLWSHPLLKSMGSKGYISTDSTTRALTEELQLSDQAPPFEAPHFCDLALKKAGERRGEVETTLDLELQETIEGYMRTQLALLAEHKVGNAAVIVAEVESGEILAMVGSGDYHRRHDGQHNTALALRQPGSTIKPFTYSLLLERTGQAGYILPDLPLYEDADRVSFVPRNYDNRFHGPVSIRTALSCSYNVPAVRALERVGTNNLLSLLRRVGFEDLSQPPEHYGLGLTLGSGSASLIQLVNGFRTFARQGAYDQLKIFPHQPSPSSVQAIDPRVCYLVTDVLSDRTARIASFGTPNALEFPFPVAVKTGTSKGYRDNWAIGFTPRHVVGVWVGNSDGSPMENVSGITGAGPLFRDIMLDLGSGGEFTRPFEMAQQRICVLSGDLANAVCPSATLEWALSEVPQVDCTICLRDPKTARPAYRMPSLYQEWAQTRGLDSPSLADSEAESLRFVFPQSGDAFLMDPDLGLDFQKVQFRCAGGIPPYQWHIDGVEAAESEENRLWWKLSPGSHTIQVRDRQNSKKTMTIEVIGNQI